MGSSANLIQVGAVFDVTPLKTGAQEAAAAVEKSLAQMQVAFNELKATSSARIAEIEAKLAEMSEAHVVHAAKSSEAMHAMGLSMEATGVGISRHLRGIIAEVPLLSKAFEALLPAFAITAGVEILKKLGEKISEIISNTFIFTDAMKEQEKALKTSNDTLATYSARIKQVGREMQIAAEHTAAGKEKLRLQFKLEDLGGDPAALRAKLQPLEAEFNKLQAVFNNPNRWAIPDALKELGFGQEAPGARVDAAKDKLAALTNQVTVLSQALKLAEAESKQAGQAITKDQADIAKATTTAGIAGAQKIKEAAVAFEKDKWDAIKALTKVGVDENAAIETGFENRLFQIKNSALQQRLALARKDADKNPAQIAAINAELEALDVTHEAELLKIKTTGIKERHKLEAEQSSALAKQTTEILAAVTEENNAVVAAADEQLRSWDEMYKGQIEAAKIASENRIQLIEQDFLKGKINQQQEIAAIAQEKERELQIEKLAQQQRWALWDGDKKKQQDIQNQINKIVAQGQLAETKAVTDGLKASDQKWKSFANNVSSSLNSALSGWIQGTQTFGQAWGKMADDMAMKFIASLERQLVEMLVHVATKEAVDQAYYAKSGLRSAYSAAKKSFDWASQFVGPILAAPIAAAAFIAVESMGSYDVGTNYVPMDGLAMLHRGEKVIPASAQGPGFSGGGDIHVHVNMGVSAVDADSFGGLIDKHSNMIGNKVARILKRRGSGK